MRIQIQRIGGILMKITRTFMDGALTLDKLVELVLEKELDQIIDCEIFEFDKEGKFGGIDYEE